MVRKPQKELAQLVVLQCLELAAKRIWYSPTGEFTICKKPSAIGGFLRRVSPYKLLSSLARYCRASAICSVKIFWQAAKSAMVLESLSTL